MDENAKSLVTRTYNERLAAFGPSLRSLGWPKGRQEIRFRVVREVGIAEGDAVLDVGCGLGDLARYFDLIGLTVRYFGCDLNVRMLEEARKRNPALELHLRAIDEDPYPENTFDWVVSTGLFELLSHENEEAQWAWIDHMLEVMLRTARKGVAIDFLSSLVDYRAPANFHADPAAVLALASRHTRRFALRHDYMPFEFYAYLYKDQNRSERNVYSAVEVGPDDEIRGALSANGAGGAR